MNHKTAWILAAGLSLVPAWAIAQSVPAKPGSTPPGNTIPSTDPLLPGDPTGRPLRTPNQSIPSTERPRVGDFARLDANADGKLSSDEVKADATMKGQFKTLDTNKDGQVDETEFNAGASGGAPVKRNRSERIEQPERDADELSMTA